MSAFCQFVHVDIAVLFRPRGLCQLFAVSLYMWTLPCCSVHAGFVSFLLSVCTCGLCLPCCFVHVGRNFHPVPSEVSQSIRYCNHYNSEWPFSLLECLHTATFSIIRYVITSSNFLLSILCSCCVHILSYTKSRKLSEAKRQTRWQKAMSATPWAAIKGETDIKCWFLWYSLRRNVQPVSGSCVCMQLHNCRSC